MLKGGTKSFEVILRQELEDRLNIAEVMYNVLQSELKEKSFINTEGGRKKFPSF